MINWERYRDGSIFRVKSLWLRGEWKRHKLSQRAALLVSVHTPSGPPMTWVKGGRLPGVN